MAANATPGHDAGHRRSWTPPRAPASYENDDLESANVEQQAGSYLGRRLRAARRNAYPDTLDLDGSEPQRKRRHVESDDETSTADGQASTNGPYFDAIRNTYTAANTPVPLSQESLRALNAKPGQSSTRLRGWLRDSTQFSVGSDRSNRHSVEYILQENGQEQTVQAPIAAAPREQHECVNCKRLFNTKSELRHHARRYEKRPYNCDQCDRSFLYPKDLRRHKTTHDGSKSYQCTSCQKAFSRKDNLRRHTANEHGNEAVPNEEALRSTPMLSTAETQPRPDSRFEDHTSHQDSMRLLASVIDANYRMAGDSTVQPNISTTRRESGNDEVKDHLVDPLMQPQRHHSQGVSKDAPIIDNGSIMADAIHEPSLLSRGPEHSNTDRDRNDVAIAQKALGWNENERARNTADSPTDVPHSRTNANYQALEVS